jgi:transposase InsO family protein
MESTHLVAMGVTKRADQEATMNEETRKQVALARYMLISPVLAERGRVQNEYFRKQAQKSHDLPHYGVRKVAVSTFKRWLRLYRKRGFDGLKPVTRADMGRPRRLGAEQMAAVRGKCKAFPHWTVKKLYEDLLASGQLGDPPICYNTLLRTVHAENLLPESGRKDVRKRFEHAEVGELWVADFMHGPQVQAGRKRAKAILCAVIDDHTRMIVGWAFSVHETVGTLTVVLKEAMLAHGVPKRLYVDNGPAFCSELLAHACAQASIALIHSRPYDSPSRGKVERFFRTVRDRFLSGVADGIDIDELREAFAVWLRDDYHHRHHAGIDQRPIDRYNATSSRVQLRRLNRAELDEIFLVRHDRIVGNDSTISFKGRIYEVPSAYIRQRVELRHPVDDDEELFLYDAGARVARLKLVDKLENARTFRPSKTDSAVSYSGEQVTQ